MDIVYKIVDLQKAIEPFRKEGKKIGMVPTMGALHKGHLTLVKQCIKENGCSVASIFVNPTQFNNKNDLLLYPRTLEEDCRLLKEAGCNIVFAPEVTEMYPKEDRRVFNLGTVGEVMEGKFRPGHFNGVAQIVSKLFEVAKPDNTYFGEKDFQQIAVIRAMAKEINSNVNIIAVPIVREDDGLAMSSRNTRLTAEQRKNAPKIWETLSRSCTFANAHTVTETIDFVTNTLNETPEMKVEYFEIINGNTLLPISSWEDAEYIVGCITVYCGEVRLIDNITYRENIDI